MIKKLEKAVIKPVAIGLCLILFISSLSTAVLPQDHTDDYDCKHPPATALNTNIESDRDIRHSVTGSQYPAIVGSFHTTDIQNRFVPGEILVEFKDIPSDIVTLSQNGCIKTGCTSIDKIFTNHHGALAVEPVFEMGDKPIDCSSKLLSFYRFTFREDYDIFSIINELNSDPNINYVGPNYIYTSCLTPDDPYYHSNGSWDQDFQDLYGIHRIDARGAWDVTTGRHDIIVAVVDSGVDYTHEDIVGNMWINDDEILGNGEDDDADGFIDNLFGADIVNNDSDPMDDYGHGTHCAGTIAAIGNNTIGVVGVNWQTSIMAVKALDGGGYATTEDLAAALKWAVDNGADVISNSWGNEWRHPSDPVIEAAVRYVYEKGCIVVFSAGNNNDEVQWYSPQNMAETITVAATDYTDTKASFSNWGDGITVCAPGVDILSLRANGTSGASYIVGENYTVASGTSMACPHVAGLAALILAVKPSCSNYMVAELIKSTADNITALNPEYEDLLGFGRINASKTIQPYDHNINVKTIDVPHHIKPSEMVHVNTVLINNGMHDEPNVLVRLFVDDVEVNHTILSSFEFWIKTEVNFTWMPPCAGRYTVTVNVTIPGVLEDTIADNEQSQIIKIGVLNKDTGELFDTIQLALDDNETLDGHTILVPKGVYYEPIGITKGISLIGMDQDTTTIHGGFTTGIVIQILNTDNVYITNFSILGGSHGISVEGCSHTTVAENTIINNDLGMEVDSNSTGCLVYHNVFNNTLNAIDTGLNNQWDNGYHGEFDLRGGNWWSDYDGTDQFRGPQQNQLWPDGIGDYPYLVQGGGETVEGMDRYPWMYPRDVYVINIDTGEIFETIQAAIDDEDTLSLHDPSAPYQPVHDPVDPDMFPGHTILVMSGTYYENLNISKILNVVGAKKETTIIDGGFSGDVVNIFVNHVTFLGFTVRNSYHAYRYPARYNYAGIDVRSKKNNISHTIITNNDHGIYLRFSSDNMIYKNNISNNAYGVFLEYQSSRNTILKNIISSNYAGVFLWPSFEGSYQYPEANSIIDNIILHHPNEGIYLENVAYNKITGNIIYNSTYGIWINYYGPSGGYLRENEVNENNIIYNAVGVSVEGYDNHIYHNNFYVNYWSAYSEGDYSGPGGTIWDNGYPSGGNYWDDYNGSDKCHGPDQNLSGPDSIGDTPYNITGAGINQDHFPLMNPWKTPYIIKHAEIPDP